MKLIADENIDRAIVLQLRADGHEVSWICEISPSVSDEVVLEQAILLGAVLITEDKDFGELVYRRKLAHLGVILLRLEGLDSTSKAQLLSDLIRDNSDQLPGAFTVVMPDSVRLRPGRI
jgi:predicted nuclease of predicted toxin-antitoxin system